MIFLDSACGFSKIFWTMNGIETTGRAKSSFFGEEGPNMTLHFKKKFVKIYKNLPNFSSFRKNLEIFLVFLKSSNLC